MAGFCGNASGQVSVLNFRQERIYTHRADIWRLLPIDGEAIGESSEAKPYRVYTAESCHFDYTDNVDTATGTGRVKIPGQFTRDRIHFAANLILHNGDYIVDVTPGTYNPLETGILEGTVHKIQGAPKVVMGTGGRVNKQSVEGMSEENPPEWMPREYPPPRT